MISIGWRNLKRDPVRPAVAILGVVFAVTLVTVEVGMLLGLLNNASLLIDRSSADLWVSALDVKTFDFPAPMDRRKRYGIESVPGVARIEEFNVSYSVWKLPSGGNVNCQVIGMDEHGQLAAKLNLVEGDLADLHNQDAVIVDQSERQKLGNPQLGESVEIFGQRAKIVGFTQGMRAFTTTPYVFTSLRRGESYGWLTSSDNLRSWGKKSIYFLVQAKAGWDPETLRATVAATDANIEVYTRSQFSWRTRKYWLTETGVGLGFLAAAVIGLLVGCVIVSQMLYAMTLEKLPEFGVLKALGATMGELSRVVLEQGLFCGGAGLAVGLLVSLGVAAAARNMGTTVELPMPLVAGVAVLTIALCSGATLMSIYRLRSLEPVMVFRA